MKHILYTFWWYSDFVKFGAILLRSREILLTKINISEDSDETQKMHILYIYVLSDDTYT